MSFLQVFLTLLFAVVVYYFVVFLRWYLMTGRRQIRMTSDLQSPGRHWFWGSLHLHPGIKEEALHWYEGMKRMYGGIYKIWFGPFLPQLVICSPQLAKSILRTAEPKPMAIPGYGVVQPWLGNGLLLANGDLWHRNRHLLTPAFHFDILKTYLSVFNYTAELMIQSLGRIEEKGEPFDIFKPAGNFTLDTILRCAFSYKNNLQLFGDKHPVVKNTHEALDLSITRSLFPYLWPDAIFYLSRTGRKFREVCRQFHEFSREVIRKRRKELTENSDSLSIKKKDFLDILLLARDEDGKGLTETEIIAEVNNFLFAGHDTTASAISWTLYALARHSSCQDKCREEVRQLLHAKGTSTMTTEDLSELTYLGMCIKETLRYHNTVPMISRQLTQDMEVGNHILPRGIVVNIMLYLIHKDKDFWDDPEDFNPERFNTETSSQRDAFSFVPFSAGPRNCLGQNFAMNELKVVVARILDNFIIGHDESRPPKLMPEGVMRTENGLWLTLQRSSHR